MHKQAAKCSAGAIGSLSGTDRDMTRNQTAQPYPTVPELVTAQAHATPDAVAAIARGETLNYRELEARASQLANFLQTIGAEPGSLVVLCLGRSLALVVGALGVLKTGAAYVPLDPSWPPDRLHFILRDCGAGLVITQKSVAARLPAGKWRVVDLDMDAAEIAGCSVSFPKVAVEPEDLAYVIYTSGSTGQPKGVQLTHAGLLNLVDWHQRAFSVGPADRAPLLASPGFDASVWELWPYLCAGASIHVPDDSLRKDAEKLQDWLIACGVTIAFVPTAMAELMISLKWPTRIPLRTMLTGADTLHRFPPANLPFTLVNNYGPTECTVVATSGIVHPCGNTTDQPTIGRPIANVQAYIVDEYLKLVPMGATGELLVGGEGLARGYINQPALTAERFIANPFSAVPGSRLYRTGDLARYLPDGQIAFVGRTDDQVKIRGYRIEPGEIVTTLARHPAVSASHVLARGDNMAERKLVAYVVPAPGERPDYAELRNFLLQRLPEYMIPAVFVLLDSMPITTNGKVDRNALPIPGESNSLRSGPAAPLQTPVETRVAGIVAGLLGLRQVGANDNFFLLGGHSLLAAQAIAKVRDNFDVEISLRTLFEAPTVAQLSAEIERLLIGKIEAMSEEEAQRRLNTLAS